MRLNKIFFTSFALLLSSFLFAQTDSLHSDTKVPGHPRLLLLKGEEASLKKAIKNDKVWNALHNAMLQECDSIIAKAPLERIQIGRRLLSVSREAIGRIFFLSYAYRLTGDKKHLQRAEKELLAISGFNDWNPSHFLDVAEMTMAASIGYDWLFDDLSPETKAVVKEAILKKGIEPSLNPKHNGWLRAEHNWNQVCNAGMTYGALATFEDHEELSRSIVNRALRSITIPMKDYNPDGAYPEGYSYWGYGTTFNVMFLSAVEKAFGTDFGLRTGSAGFLKTGGYLENMTGPSGKPFNYSDAGDNGELQPAMFWFAARAKDPSLLWVERSRLMAADPKSHVKNRLLPAIMLWSGNTGINSITQPKSLMWTGRGKMPVALMRSSWTEPNAIWVGFKGGTVGANHAHMDVGSFVMEADGVRWAMDFGMQGYESLESKGIQLFGRTQDAQRWTVFRLTNLVHNTLTANGQHQRVTGSAPFLRTSFDPAFMQATTDMSEVYKGALAKAVRGMAIVDKKYVVVRDEVQARDTATVVRWTMLTPANVKITGSNTAELTRNGKRLLLHVAEPANVTMKTWSTDPPNSYDALNPGTTLVGFEVLLPPGATSALTVKLLPAGTEKSATQKVQPLQDWKGDAVTQIAKKD